MVKSFYLKDSKEFKKAYAKAESDLNELMSKEATEGNVAQVKSILNFIESLNKAAENYSSAAKYVDDNFVIDEYIKKLIHHCLKERQKEFLMLVKLK